MQRIAHRHRALGRGGRGATLLEFVLLLSVTGAILATAMPAFHETRDRLAAEGAAAHTTRALTDARHHAVTRAARTAVWLDSASARITVVAGPDTIAVHPLGSLYGVTLLTTRDSIAWSATGLGYGAANARVILQRGAAAETVIVSRLGRIRR